MCSPSYGLSGACVKAVLLRRHAYASECLRCQRSRRRSRSTAAPKTGVSSPRKQLSGIHPPPKLNTTSGQLLKKARSARRAAGNRCPPRPRVNLVWNSAFLTYPATFRARSSLRHMNAKLAGGNARPDALNVRQRRREAVEIDRLLGLVGIGRVEFNKPIFSHHHRPVGYHFLYTNLCDG